MKSVYMICGLGNSGKSTYAKKLQEEFSNENVVICSVDEFRRNDFDKVTIEEAIQKMIEKVKKSFVDNNVIIIDFSFTTIECRTWFLKEFNLPFNIDFNCIYLYPSQEKIVENGFKRNSKYIINEEKRKKINEWYNGQEIPKEEEFNFEKINIKVVV